MARVVAMLQGEVDSGIVENDLALGRSNMKLPPSSLFSLESELELSNISEGLETSSLVLYNHLNASMNATSNNIEHLHYWCAYYSHNYFESLALDIVVLSFILHSIKLF